MYRSGLLPLTFEGLQQDFGGKNCQNGSRGKPCIGTSTATRLWEINYQHKISILLLRSNFSPICLKHRYKYKYEYYIRLFTTQLWVKAFIRKSLLVILCAIFI